MHTDGDSGPDGSSPGEGIERASTRARALRAVYKAMSSHVLEGEEFDDWAGGLNDESKLQSGNSGTSCEVSGIVNLTRCKSTNKLKYREHLAQKMTKTKDRHQQLFVKAAKFSELIDVMEDALLQHGEGNG